MINIAHIWGMCLDALYEYPLCVKRVSQVSFIAFFLNYRTGKKV